MTEPEAREVIKKLNQLFKGGWRVKMKTIGHNQKAKANKHPRLKNY